MPDTSKPIRIATRSSPLALWQAHEVRDLLLRHHPEIVVEICPMTTDGDRWLDSSLAKLGGKGLFVKELELALIENRADIAVHSMKDVTAVLPEGLCIKTVLQREDPFDALVSNKFKSLDELPENAIIGTCSPRRLSQIKYLNANFEIRDLRGNVNTRLAKLDAGNFDAIVLACAGLRRLGFEQRIAATLAPELCLPAVGQGTIGVESRQQDLTTQELLKPLHHAESEVRLAAERALSASLNGGCSAPVAGYTTLADNSLQLTARVIALDGSTLIETRDQIQLPSNADQQTVVMQAQALGESAAEQLRAQGAQAILDAAEAEHQRSREL